jgi:hypothetical protein
LDRNQSKSGENKVPLTGLRVYLGAPSNLVTAQINELKKKDDGGSDETTMVQFPNPVLSNLAPVSKQTMLAFPQLVSLRFGAGRRMQSSQAMAAELLSGGGSETPPASTSCSWRPPRRAPQP